MIPVSVFILIGVILGFTSFLCLFRGVKGPSVPDRVVAINVIGTKTMVIMVLFAFMYDRPFFIDVAIIYALVNFISTITISIYLEKGRLEV